MMCDEYSYDRWADELPPESCQYVAIALLHMMPAMSTGTRVLDVGCGNGYIVGWLLRHGCKVVGIDLSESGVQVARKNYPQGRFEVLAADQQVLKKLNERPFDYVVSTEVIEHLYAPRPFMQGCFSALKPGGRLICSTPYNGYFKTLAIALTGHFDAHFNPLWDGGHVKFWTRKTLTRLFVETGLINLEFRGAGRSPYLWKSMLMAGERPADAAL